MDLSTAEVLLVGLGILLGWVGGRQMEHHARRDLELTGSKMGSDWFSDLRSWASEAIDVLAEAEYASSSAPELTDALRSSLRSRLSALIDRGRLLIPNYPGHDVGEHKPPAFRGIRPASIDFLVAAHDFLGQLPYAGRKLKTLPEALLSARRGFVSEIQEIIDPRSHNKLIYDLLAETRPRSDGLSALERLTQDQDPRFNKKDAT